MALLCFKRWMPILVKNGHPKYLLVVKYRQHLNLIIFLTQSTTTQTLILAAIESAPNTTAARTLAAHVALDGNGVCADCGAEGVEWASASRGVTVGSL